MYIYNINFHSLSPCQHILDPDYQYHSNLEKDFLYAYFKNLIKPRGIHLIAGIYIKYEIDDFIYQQYPQFYEKAAKAIEDKIKNYLDFGNANLFNCNADFFFLTMFNIKEKDITDALLLLIKDINKRHFKKYNKMHYFHMKCGIYYSHPQIPPFEFYECSKKQYENIIQKDSLISYNFYPPSQQ